MASVIKYSVRGRLGTTVYKIVGGKVRKLHELRGEDLHDSPFDAIYHGAPAMRAWGFRPIGLVIDVHERIMPL